MVIVGGSGRMFGGLFGCHARLLDVPRSELHSAEALETELPPYVARGVCGAIAQH